MIFHSFVTKRFGNADLDIAEIYLPDRGTHIRFRQLPKSNGPKLVLLFLMKVHRELNSKKIIFVDTTQ